MDATIASILALDGLTNGAIYALLALATVLVFAVTRVIFIPQGEFVAFGALTLALLQTGQVPGTVWFLLVLVAAVVAEQLPDNHPSKAVAVDFVTKFEAAYGAGSRNQFAGHAYDAQIVMEKVLPVALKKAKPGTPEFRAALRDAIETMGRTIFSHGVMNWSASDHWGYTNETGVLLKVSGGKFVVEK